MARDPGLEEMIEGDLAGVRGLSQKAMFGGLAWLLHGNLLCAARENSLLVRVGKGNDSWALRLPGVELRVMNGRPMSGWVRARAAFYASDTQRGPLMQAALEFVRTLPKK